MWGEGRCLLTWLSLLAPAMQASSTHSPGCSTITSGLTVHLEEVREAKHFLSDNRHHLCFWPSLVLGSSFPWGGVSGAIRGWNYPHVKLCSVNKSVSEALRLRPCCRSRRPEAVHCLCPTEMVSDLMGPGEGCQCRTWVCPPQTRGFQSTAGEVTEALGCLPRF